MKNVLQKISIVSIGFLTPALVFAQGDRGIETGGVKRLLVEVNSVISYVIPVLISLGVLAFMWGVVMYLFKPDKSDGKMFMLWGIIALFVMTSVWGLVGILRGTLFGSGVDDGNRTRTVNIPQVPGN
jgi:predicted permease